MTLEQKVTVVMYHYVRDLKNSKYPNIKGLDIKLFNEQILYLKKNYNVISMEEFFNAIFENSKLPKRPALLTFDDGFIDHYSNVFPILEKNNLKGCFYPPIFSIIENKVLDVHKIHHILATGVNTKDLIEEIKKFTITELNQDNVFFESLYSKHAISNRYDNKEIIFIKRILQSVLELSQRERLTDMLFKKFVEFSEEELSKILYMKEDEINEMFKSGHHFGSHGFKHYWWNECNTDQLNDEIQISKKFLIDLGMKKNGLTCCYPYGGISKKVIEMAKRAGFRIGFTTEVNIANLNKSDSLLIPRLDTNDLPKEMNAIDNKWLDYA